MNLLNQWLPLLMIATGDDSKPWLIVVCLIVSIAMMVVLFLLGNNGNDKGGKSAKK